MSSEEEGATPLPETENRAPIEARLPLSSSLVGSDDTGNRTRTNSLQGASYERHVLADDQLLAAIGSPRIVIDRYASETRVWVDRKPWGFANTDRVFLGVGTQAAKQYALGLFGTFAEQAAERVKYRLRRKARNAAGREAARMIRGERGQ